MRRRLFLGLSLGVVGVATMFGIGYTATEAEIASMVRRRLSFLKLDEAGLKAYAKDQVGWYLAKRPSWNHIKRHLHSAAPPGLARVYRAAEHPTRMQKLQQTYVTQYLLSSDFFYHGADGKRVVQYLSFYDPLKRPCANPFARPVQVS